MRKLPCHSCACISDRACEPARARASENNLDPRLRSAMTLAVARRYSWRGAAKSGDRSSGVGYQSGVPPIEAVPNVTINNRRIWTALEILMHAGKDCAVNWTRKCAQVTPARSNDSRFKNIIFDTDFCRRSAGSKELECSWIVIE